jgi:predicted NBD/HSP70 family sugar kinase
MNKNSIFFVGLDLGDKFSYIAIVDEEGEEIEENLIP